MATEILTVPEDHLRDVIAILRAGMEATRTQGVPIPAIVYEQLVKWCDEEEAYLAQE